MVSTYIWSEEIKKKKDANFCESFKKQFEILTNFLDKDAMGKSGPWV